MKPFNLEEAKAGKPVDYSEYRLIRTNSGTHVFSEDWRPEEYPCCISLIRSGSGHNYRIDLDVIYKLYF